MDAMPMPMAIKYLKQIIIKLIIISAYFNEKFTYIILLVDQSRPHFGPSLDIAWV